MHMKRVCCLYRVSTKGQVEKDDIPMQKQVCHEFANANGWVITEEHFEKGVSGFKTSADDRDALQEIKKSALNQKFDILLVFMFDRLGRREDETPFVVQWFHQHGIEIWSTYEGQQRFDSHVDKLMNYIRFWQASGESEKTSVRTKTRLGQIVQEGRYRGGYCPYGYRLEKQGRLNKKGHEVYEIVVDEYEASIVHDIFDMYANKGMGTYQIAMQLTNQKVLSRSGSWHPSTIIHMLGNITYTGILRSSESRSDPFDHLRIIDDDLFDRTQELKKQRSRENTQDRSAPMSNKSQSLLSGNIFCGHCGGRLGPTTSGKNYTRKDGSVKENKRHCYTCYNQNRRRAECDGPRSYTCHLVDDIISLAIRNLFESLTGSPKEAMRRTLNNNRVSDNHRQLSEAKEQLEQAQKKLRTIKEEIIECLSGNSAFSKEELSIILSEQNERVSSLTNRVDVLAQDTKDGEQQIDASMQKLDCVRSWAQSFDGADLETKKMIVANLISKVIVKRDYEIEIVFNVDIEVLKQVA